jgi:hypothetical protein
LVRTKDPYKYKQRARSWKLIIKTFATC